MKFSQIVRNKPSLNEERIGKKGKGSQPSHESGLKEQEVFELKSDDGLSQTSALIYRVPSVKQGQAGL